jgi:prepilin peptidase CpaA
MQGHLIINGCVGALAVALLVAAFTDIRRRQIDNWLNAGIALTAPVFWWASGLTLWPDVALQLALALGAFVVLAALFAIRAMGGGDVKLLTALALWLPASKFMSLLIVMALAGGVLTLALGAWHVARRQKDKLKIPYGVAIALAGLWTIGGSDATHWHDPVNAGKPHVTFVMSQPATAAHPGTGH